MMNDKRTIERLRQGLTAFESVVNKEIHYVYFKEGLYQELVFKPQKSNFMHLCGVEYQNPRTKQMIRPSQFYAALKSNKISPEGILKKSFTDLCEVEGFDTSGYFEKMNNKFSESSLNFWDNDIDDEAWNNI